MTVPTFTITGQDELVIRLNELEQEYGPRNTRSVYNRVIRDVLRPVEDDIRQNTPVRTGHVSRFISTRIRSPRRGELLGPHANPDTVIIGTVGYHYRRGESSFRPFVALEYGTSRFTGRSPLRNAFNRNRNTMLRDFSRLLGESIERRAQQLNRRRQRQGAQFRRR